MNQYKFKVTRSFKTVDGRECEAGATVELRDRDEVRRLLSLGFILPGGPRNCDIPSKREQSDGKTRKFKAPNASTFYTR